VTLNGANFQNGASANFGAGITTNSTTFNSAAQLTANITVDALAAFGPRDVTVTNPGNLTGTLPNGFTVTPPQAAISLTFNGKLRDKVGQGEVALSPDGALDATFTVTLLPGSSNRTVTSLDLTSGPVNRWNTTVDGTWALGAASSLDTALYNASNSSVNFPVSEGASFNLFASDYQNSLFPPGTGFNLTVRFADGSSATASTTVPSNDT
jgi:hypothetical protein